MNFSLLGTFGAGVLTFLSPCVLPLAPILVANLMSVQNPSRFDRLKATVWFCLGFTLVFVLFGMSLPLIHSALGGAKPWLLALSGAALAAFGLRMMGMLGEGRLVNWLSRSFHLPEFGSKFPKGIQGFVFGALFGLSWTPCVGPVLGGVLTYVASQEAAPLQGAALLSSFALGISLPLIAIAVASDRVLPLLQRLKRYLPRIEYAAGLGLFIFGVYVVSQARLQDFVYRGQPDGALTATTHKQQVIRLDQRKAGMSRMVFFYSDNCPVCHAMESYLPEFEEACASNGFELVRINVDRSENSAAAEHFGVRAVPTISMLNSEGAELVHLVGYQTQSRLREAAKAVTKLACAQVKSAIPAELEDQMLPAGTKTSCEIGAAC